MTFSVSLQLLTAGFGTTRKDSRAASNSSALGGRGDKFGLADRIHFMPDLDPNQIMF